MTVEAAAVVKTLKKSELNKRHGEYLKMLRVHDAVEMSPRSGAGRAKPAQKKPAQKKAAKQKAKR